MNGGDVLDGAVGAAVAVGLVGGPVCFPYLIGEKLVADLFGGLVAGVGEGVGFGVVGGTDAGWGDGLDEDVGEGAGADLVGPGGDGEAASEDAEEGGGVAFVRRGEGQGDGEDDVGMELAADEVGGEVFGEGTVDVDVAAVLERREDAGDGDGGADGFGEGAVGEDGLLADEDVGGDAAEGMGRLLKSKLAP